MIKKIFLTIIIFSLLLIMAISVYAAGSSGSSNQATNTVGDSDPAFVDCEKGDLRTRIKCRLDNAGNVLTVSGSDIDESCRELQQDVTSDVGFTLQDCQKLYSDSGEDGQNCYDLALTPKQRHRCFLSVAGLDPDKILSDQIDDKKRLRMYIILRLYNAQEKIEAAFERGCLDKEVGADLITQIIEIKIALQDGTPKEDIRQKLQSLRADISSVREQFQC